MFIDGKWFLDSEQLRDQRIGFLHVWVSLISYLLENITGFTPWLAGNNQDKSHLQVQIHTSFMALGAVIFQCSTG